MASTTKHGKYRLSSLTDEATYKQIEDLAHDEARSITFMIESLIKQALNEKNRNRKKKKDYSVSDHSAD